MSNHENDVKPENQLVLSLFPGIGMLDMAFEEQGFCIVRGPDVLWGGDVKRFRPIPGRFQGVIGGPPCQAFSSLRHIVAHVYGPDKVADAQPDWFLMENVPAAPAPIVPGYAVHSFKLNNRWLGEVQERKRVFSFGVRAAERSLDLRNYIEIATFENIDSVSAVCARGGDATRRIALNGSGKPKKHKNPIMAGWHVSSATVKQSAAQQGLPEAFLDKAPFTVEGKQKVIGNGVPLPMGRAIAKAIVQALSTRAGIQPSGDTAR